MKSARKDIWSYLDSIGVKLTNQQHEEFRDLLKAAGEGYSEVYKTELEITKLKLKKASRQRHFFWWRLNRTK